MTHLVGHSQNAIPVYVDLITSPAAKHIAARPNLLTLAAEALEQLALVESTISLEHNMRRIIGYDFVVKTAATDLTFYVQLVRDNAFTHFTKSGKPSPTRRLSLILLRAQSGASYIIHDVWIGRLTPPLPGTSQETAQSKAYWETHAVIFENQAVQSRTLTHASPY